MLKKYQLMVAVFVASGIVFGSIPLFADNFPAPKKDETSQEETKDGIQTPEERLRNLEEQVIALADQLGMNSDSNNPISSDGNSIARGKALYAKRCASCHGSRGQGGGAMSRVVKNIQNLADPSMWDRDDEMLYSVITNGAPRMPAFKNLKEEDRWNIINYIRTFSPKPYEN